RACFWKSARQATRRLSQSRRAPVTPRLPRISRSPGRRILLCSAAATLDRSRRITRATTRWSCRTLRLSSDDVRNAPFGENDVLSGRLDWGGAGLGEFQKKKWTLAGFSFHFACAGDRIRIVILTPMGGLHCLLFRERGFLWSGIAGPVSP